MAERLWGQGTSAGSDYSNNACILMGGPPPDYDDLVLLSVGLYVGALHSKQVRLAVYQGGSTTFPTGASLLEDLGQTTGSAVNQFISFSSSTNPIIARDEPLWIAAKGNTVGGAFSLRWDAAIPEYSNFYTDHGRTVVAAMGTDDTTAFPATVPSGGTNDVGWYIYYMIVRYEPANKDWSIYKNHGTATNSPVYTYSPLKRNRPSIYYKSD